MSEKETKKPFNFAAFVQGPVFMLILICVPVCFALLNVVLSKSGSETPPAIEEPVNAPVVSRRGYAGDGQNYPVITTEQSLACDFRSWLGRQYNMNALRGLNRPYRFLTPNAEGLKVENTARVNLEVDNRKVITKIWCG